MRGMKPLREMKRAHRLTHPLFGVISWPELRSKVEAFRKKHGRKACWWCTGEVPKKCRTRCASKECASMISLLVYWQDSVSSVFRRDNGKCVLCSASNDGRTRFEVDHIIPVSLGGTGDLNNLRLLCLACHKAATARLRKMGKNYVAIVS